MSQALREIARYLQRHALFPPQIEEPPHEELGLVVVVPCYNEPGLFTTLEALWQLARPQAAVEILVVLNASQAAPPEAVDLHHRQLEEATSWLQEHQDPRFRVFFLSHPALPRKHAGVGTARKIGLDEGLWRLYQRQRPQGILLSTDADCSFKANYLTAVEAHFAAHPEAHIGHVHYEHPLSGGLDPAYYEAIVQYELHLRYYAAAIAWAGHPYGFQTVGSTMLKRGHAYARIGGMNRRKAGEDFYFLQKAAQNTDIFAIYETEVYPSPRISERVPFGTGQAQRKLLSDPAPIWHSYHPQAFCDLKAFLADIPSLFRIEEERWARLESRWPETLKSFLHSQEFRARCLNLNQNTTTPQSFEKRFFHWFNGFVVMKWVHYFRDHQEPNIPVVEALQWLRSEAGEEPQPEPLALLHWIRAAEKRGIFAKA